MKPYVPAPLTLEDINIWIAIERRHGAGTRYHAFNVSDRRDAELMLAQMIDRCIVAFDEPAEPPTIGRRVILHVMKGAAWPAQEVHGLEYP
jgi:hypothetical protein